MPKFTSLALTALIFILISGLSACDKCAKSLVNIDQRTLDMCFYKSGSYWIYEDSINHNFDTVKVEDVEHGYSCFDHAYEGNLEYVRMNHSETSDCASTLIGINVKEVPDALVIGCIADSDIRFLYSSRVEIDSFDHYLFDSIFLEATYDSLLFNNKIYYDVVAIGIKYRVSQNPKAKLYWSAHLGLIRYELYGKEVWNLVDYQVFQ